jgi:hypothetical protein
VGSPNFIQQKLLNLKAKIGIDTIIVGYFINNPLSQIGHPDKNINKETSVLKYTIDQMD